MAKPPGDESVSCAPVMLATFLLFLLFLFFWDGGGMMTAAGGIFIQLLFWAAVIILTYFVLKGVLARGAGAPLDVLNRRYATGEIGRMEYQRMKKELNSR